MKTTSITEKIHHGENLLLNGDIPQALKVFDSILDIDPANTFALNDRSVALNKLGRYWEAIDVCLHILNTHGNDSTAAFNLISNYLVIQDWQRAGTTLSKYAHCLEDTDVRTFRKELARLRSTHEKASHSHFSTVFGGFDGQNVQQRINDVLNKNLFFIIASPKSGTTWLQHVLNGHPEIHCSGEDNFNQLKHDLEHAVNQYNYYMSATNNGIGTTNFCQFTRQNLEYLFLITIGVLLANFCDNTQVPCIGSKNPILVKCPEIYARLMPKARFIHIIRDGRDVIVSLWFNNLRVAPEQTKRRWPSFCECVAEGVREWAEDIQKAQAFGVNHPDRYLELRYEDLHDSPETSIKRVLEFLDVDASIPMIAQCRQAGEFRTLARGRDRGQEDQADFFRKGVIGDWKNHFDKASLDLFMSVAGPTLEKYGYT